MNNFNNCNGDPRDTLIFSTAPPPTWMDGENNIDWRKMYENKCNHKRNVDKNVKVWKENITIEISNMDDKICELKLENFDLEMMLSNISSTDKLRN